MNIQTKFNIGDWVYIKTKKNQIIKTPCSVCEGDGNLYSKISLLPQICKKCDGKGYTCSDEFIPHIEYAKVHSISVVIEKETLKIKYMLDVPVEGSKTKTERLIIGMKNEFNQDRLFKTLEEVK